MAEHLSDQEQIENLKRWWQENGRQLLLMVVLVLGGWFGWQQWQDVHQQKAADASLVFAEIIDLVQAENIADLNSEQQERLTTLADSLRGEYSDSQYAQYATLALARLAVARNELDEAAGFLQEVINSASDRELAALTRARLARVRLAQKQYPGVLEVLDVDVETAMRGLYAELRGDAYYHLEDYPAARAAYQLALDNASPTDPAAYRLLELKLNRVLEAAAPVTVESVDTESEDAG